MTDSISAIFFARTHVLSSFSRAIPASGVSGFNINQAINIILAGKAWYKFVLVLVDSPFQVACESNIETTRTTAEDVRVVLSHDAPEWDRITSIILSSL